LKTAIDQDALLSHELASPSTAAASLISFIFRSQFLPMTRRRRHLLQNNLKEAGFRGTFYTDSFRTPAAAQQL